MTYVILCVKLPIVKIGNLKQGETMSEQLKINGQNAYPCDCDRAAWISGLNLWVCDNPDHAPEPNITDDSDKICDCGEPDCNRPFNHVLEP